MRKSEQIESIENMTKSLDSMENLILGNNIEPLEKVENSAQTIEMRIKVNFSNDTIDYDLGKKIDDFLQMYKNIKPLKKDYEAIKTSVVNEKNILKNLRNDIENGYGERAKYDEFVLFEEKKVNRFYSMLSEYLEQREIILKTYDELHDELNNYSLELEYKNKKVQ